MLLQGDSDLQLERMNVYFNEASGGARRICLMQHRSHTNLSPFAAAAASTFCLDQLACVSAGRYVPRAVLMDLVHPPFPPDCQV